MRRRKNNAKINIGTQNRVLTQRFCIPDMLACKAAYHLVSIHISVYNKQTWYFRPHSRAHTRPLALHTHPHPSCNASTSTHALNHLFRRTQPFTLSLMLTYKTIALCITHVLHPTTKRKNNVPDSNRNFHP